MRLGGNRRSTQINQPLRVYRRCWNRVVGMTRWEDGLLRVWAVSSSLSPTAHAHHCALSFARFDHQYSLVKDRPCRLSSGSCSSQPLLWLFTEVATSSPTMARPGAATAGTSTITTRPIPRRMRPPTGHTGKATGLPVAMRAVCWAPARVKRARQNEPSHPEGPSPQ